jgi:DNA repair exonuclease SbcCD nuclease subunit
MYRLEKFFDQLDRIYKERACDTLWDLGDTTDDRSYVPVKVIDLLCDRLQKYAGKWNIKLVGNHEQYSKDTSVHSGKMFRQFFRVVESCENLPFAFQGVNILCMSYHDDNRVITDFLRKHRGGGPTVVLGHAEIFGCHMPGGMSSSGIDRKEFDFADLTLMGHIHKPQSIGKIHYVGSPFQQDWGEAGEKKRVGILDIEDGEINLEWVVLEGFPEYSCVSLPEFVSGVTPDSEDRFKVVLHSVEETEQFYASPLSGRADEPVYDYQQPVGSTESGTDSGAVIPRTKQDIMRRYLEKNSPQANGIPIDIEAMLEYGEQVSGV